MAWRKVVAVIMGKSERTRDKKWKSGGQSELFVKILQKRKRVTKRGRAIEKGLPSAGSFPK